TACATTLIVARFLWLAWPRPAARESTAARSAGRAMLTAWVATLALAASAVWLVPLADLPSLWSAHALWSVTWPVLLGAAAATAVGAAILRGRLPSPPSVPNGDVLAVFIWMANRLLEAWAQLAGRWLPAARDRWLGLLRAERRLPIWASVVEGAEELLGLWSIAVTLFVAVLVLLGAATIVL